MSIVIGLCGGSGSGKGLVGRILSEFGYFHIDTDKVYRDLTDNKSFCLDALVCEFGADILTDRGALDRKKLAEIVFNDWSKLKILNEITHSFILDRVREIIRDPKNDHYRGFVVDAPLLYESGFNKECDFTIAVTADAKTRIERVIKRDKITAEAAEKRIKSQTSDEYISALSDYTIENNGDCESLKAQLINILGKLN